MSVDSLDPGRPSIAPSTGEVIDGKFRVERRIGEGGMGLVLEATHLKLDERVALKFLRPEVLERADIVARFTQEARAAVKLKSEHVARVIDVGEHRGLPFMVMELLQGNDLEEILAKNGPLPVHEAAELIIQACEGINEAHAKGIVHRDIKPANLFVSQSGHGSTLKVLDFGISKAALTGKVSDVDLASRKTTSVMGSPYYMSPEQLRSTRDVDLRTDIWAMGTVLYELLTGRTAIVECDDFPQLVIQILESKPRTLAEAMASPPEGLQAVLDRCLEKDRTLRYQSAAELAIALVPFAKSRDSAVIASRAAKVTRSAGIDPNLRAPWSLPPGALPDSKPDIKVDPTLVRTDLTLSPEPARTSKVTTGEQAPPPERTRSKGALYWAVGGAFALLIIGYGAVRATAKPDTTTTAPTATTATTPTAPTADKQLAVAPPAPAPSPAASVSQEVAPDAKPPASAEPALTTVGKAAAAPTNIRPSRPNVAPRTAPHSPPATSASSKGVDLEIRRER